MTIEGLIIWLVIGAVAGWLAGLLVKGYGFGLIPTRRKADSRVLCESGEK